MVNSIAFKGREGKILPLKSRRDDFLRLGVKDAQGVDSWSCELFTLRWAPTRFDGQDFHIGFTITIKGVSKLAVIRNYVRRVLRASANKTVGRHQFLKGYDLLFLARAAIRETPYAKLAGRMDEAFTVMERKEHGTIGNKMGSKPSVRRA
ncbi:MAG: ribonuclease P protein component [Rickettsiales bacterium]|jgi:ribonuclease P protein component|nr:ribonuclease P protein component [Rickettsiales bacterium]